MDVHVQCTCLICSDVTEPQQYGSPCAYKAGWCARQVVPVPCWCIDKFKTAAVQGPLAFLVPPWQCSFHVQYESKKFPFYSRCAGHSCSHYFPISKISPLYLVLSRLCKHTWCKNELARNTLALGIARTRVTYWQLHKEENCTVLRVTVLSAENTALLHKGFLAHYKETGTISRRPGSGCSVFRLLLYIYADIVIVVDFWNTFIPTQCSKHIQIGELRGLALQKSPFIYTVGLCVLTSTEVHRWVAYTTL